MATFVWTLPTASGGSGGGNTGLGSELDKLYGRDIYLEINGESGPDYAVAKHGDWLLVTGREALRQSLIRRWITNPGSWNTKPEYGAGALSYVKARNRSSSRADLAERIRSQTLKDKRVARVDTIEVSYTENALRLRVIVIPRGEAAKPLPVVLEMR